MKQTEENKVYIVCLFQIGLWTFEAKSPKFRVHLLTGIVQWTYPFVQSHGAKIHFVTVGVQNPIRVIYHLI